MRQIWALLAIVMQFSLSLSLSSGGESSALRMNTDPLASRRVADGLAPPCMSNATAAHLLYHSSLHDASAFVLSRPMSMACLRLPNALASVGGRGAFPAVCARQASVDCALLKTRMEVKRDPHSQPDTSAALSIGDKGTQTRSRRQGSMTGSRGGGSETQNRRQGSPGSERAGGTETKTQRGYKHIRSDKNAKLKGKGQVEILKRQLPVTHAIWIEDGADF
jgi:hypothetical protein